MFILANIIQILIIGYVNNRLTIKTALISILPFIFLIFLTFFDLTFTYMISVYYLTIILGLFHLLENKNGVVRQAVIILFINYTISFILVGEEHLQVLSSIKYVNLQFIFVNVINIVVWYVFFRIMTFFKFILDESSSILELLFNIVTILFSVFLAFILDTRDSTVFYIYSDILYYLIFLSYILIFLVGRLGIYIYRSIIERENVLQNNIEFQKNKLSYLKGSFEEKSIKLLTALIAEENYEKALAVTTKHFDFEVKTRENIKKINLISNLPLKTFIKSKFTSVSDLSLSIEVNDSLFDVELQAYNYFFEILGIVLDNAIEAAYQTKEKRLDFIINRHDLQTTEFIIKNSATEDAKSNLQDKITKKGDTKRMNGLKILDILVQRTDIVVITNVEETVTTKVILS